MAKIETTYQSYLLRLWRKAKPGAQWQAMLESISPQNERHYFKDLESLVSFIQNLHQESSNHKEAER